MQRTSLVRFLAKITLKIALFALGAILTVHLVAAVSLPVLQAFSEGLQRANTVQMVAISPDSTTDALTEEVAYKR